MIRRTLLQLCHCGLDPQSPSKDTVSVRGSRVKRGMTRRECYPRSIVLACLCLLIVSFCLYRQYPVYEAYKKKTSTYPMAPSVKEQLF
jgi:hypothetical protein